MNSCILMADIIQEPQLRYTADNNLAVTEMLVQFSNSQRPDDPPATLKVVSWGNLATEVQQNYHQGDRVIIEGRLGMITFERRNEGFKEKRAELTIQRIHPVGKGFSTASVPDTYSQPASSATDVTPAYSQADASSYEPPRSTAAPATSNVGVAPPVTKPEPVYQPSNFERTYTPVTEEPDPDDIPF